MRKIRFILALWSAKTASLLCKLLKSRGSTAPGRIALKICPDFIKICADGIKEKIIVVCGTNGKTSTNNFIYSILKASGYEVVCNKAGANMLTGIAAAFSKKTSIFGKIKADFASLEVDEANMPLLFKHIKPDFAVVTNLFRDQLDRYGEIDATSNLLKKAFLLSPETQLILNADDPVTSIFETKKKNIYYSIKRGEGMILANERKDGSLCPKCGTALNYEYFNYGQLGKFSCENCGFENPASDFSADNIIIKDGDILFDIKQGEKSITTLKSRASALYNAYNMLAAFLTCTELGIDEKISKKVLEEIKPEPGRMSKFSIKEKTVYLILSKNPTGFNQSVTTVINDPRKKDILISVNDNAGDGNDISWIYDVDFESLVEYTGGAYTFFGQRKYDMYLRLRLALCPEENMKIATSIEDAAEKMLSGECEVVYALVNYTAMYPFYVYLKKLEEEGSKNA